MGVGAALWQELVAGFPDSSEIARIAARLIGCNAVCSPKCSYLAV